MDKRMNAAESIYALIESLCQKGFCSYDRFADYRELVGVWGFNHWASYAGLETLVQEVYRNPLLTLASHPSSVVIMWRWVSQGETQRFNNQVAWGTKLEAYEAAFTSALKRK
jgi:hypothetical protein